MNILDFFSSKFSVLRAEQNKIHIRNKPSFEEKGNKMRKKSNNNMQNMVSYVYCVVCNNLEREKKNICIKKRDNTYFNVIYSRIRCA